MAEHDPRERLPWIALAWASGMTPAAFWRVLQQEGVASAALGRPAAELTEPPARLQPEVAEAVEAAEGALAEVEETLLRLEENGVQVLCACEPGFPARLREAQPMPPVLSVWGGLRAEDEPAVSIIGTRSASADGLRMACELAAAFVREGLTVVSGLARGCDTAAHVGALDAGGRTMAVLGCGINVCHPSENAPLAHRIAAAGAVLSEQAPETRPNVGRLMARNRLQSALSNAVVVVEAGTEGGSHETAAVARRQGRLVVGVEWPPSDRPERAGVAQLLAAGALPVRGPEDVPDLAARVREHLSRPRGRRPRGGEQAQLALWEE